MAASSEPTGSGTFLSFAAFLQPKWKIDEVDFSWVEPLKPRDPNLFDIRLKCRAKPDAICCFLQGYGPSFDTLLTLRSMIGFIPAEKPHRQALIATVSMNSDGSKLHNSFAYFTCSTSGNLNVLSQKACSGP
jgi:hypothetical protein